ncbi:MAG: translation initiation factor IF-3 [Chloroflexi bacterium]|nr:translation initiation factor IF-3 [Chloroflexota bacterium]
MSRELRVNERIRIPQVRLIGENGEQLGIVNTADAIGIARQRGLDLVEVAPTAAPPVCRLLDYGRFKYEQEKKDREARKNQKIILLKEVRFRPKTDDHDLDFKTKAIERFIEDGEKVKVTIRFRGRELAHPNIGRQVLEQVVAKLKDGVLVERMPQLEGNSMTMILSKGKDAAPPVPEGAPRPVAPVAVAASVAPATAPVARSTVARPSTAAPTATPAAASAAPRAPATPAAASAASAPATPAAPAATPAAVSAAPAAATPSAAPATPARRAATRSGSRPPA